MSSTPLHSGSTLGLCLMALAGCASTGTTSVISASDKTLYTTYATPVLASGETAPVGTANDDAADDPAIWRNAENPQASLIVGTDKKAGIYVYGLDGAVRSFLPGGRLNNIDLADMGVQGVIVVASDRNDVDHALLQLYRLDTQAGKLIPLGAVPGGEGEGYGLCLMRVGDSLHAFSILKHGGIAEVALDLSGAAPRGELLRMHAVPSQAEGCLADPRTGMLYVGEEDAGIWAFDVKPGASDPGRMVASVDGHHLVADVEGLALAPEGETGGWLIASSQGDSAFALYELPSFTPAGRFRVMAGALGSVEETDGIELALGDFGSRYPQGLFVAQDGVNTPHAQNFKLISWGDIQAALAADQQKQGR